MICPSGHAIGKRQRLRWQAKRSAHDAQPRLRDPAAIFARGIAGIEQMTETVLGPAHRTLLRDIDTGAQQFRLAVAIAQKERVPLGGNRQAPELPLPLGLRVEVVVLDLENRVAAPPCDRTGSAERIESTISPLAPRINALDRLAAVIGAVRSARACNQAAVFARDDRHGIGVLHRVRAAAIGDQALQQREQQMTAARNERGQRRGKQNSPGDSGMLDGTFVRLGIDAVAGQLDLFVALLAVHLRKDAVARRAAERLERTLEPIALGIAQLGARREAIAFLDDRLEEVL